MSVSPSDWNETAPREVHGKPHWFKEALEWAKTITISFLIVMVLHLFVFNLSTVEGHSMEPTLRDREWLFVNKAAYLIGNPKLGDIVILEDPSAYGTEKDYLVKRVVGVAGDRIEIYNKQLYRNGEKVSEAYTDVEIEDLDFMPVIVPKGQYFVMGDNRHARASKDSRIFGTVPRSMIHGRADFILWPFKQVKVL
ncbi:MULTISPECIES: signal peptidase I [unclassified Paenibacillus]|uniref:signal peptidase I n=1 Tax=unclassified Paenibacillus TaxID=185978 RepID=UPI00104B6D84|nr:MULTISPECIES: signal peptidase I [unclassified Paenibacillus]NIK69567.1 signal peptidase I [Paenibacillus sp. BK720]TCM95744.1 signal peptidase I [Paenibacillus sp. BK033]